MKEELRAGKSMEEVFKKYVRPLVTSQVVPSLFLLFVLMNPRASASPLRRLAPRREPPSLAPGRPARRTVASGPHPAGPRAQRPRGEAEALTYISVSAGNNRGRSKGSKCKAEQRFATGRVRRTSGTPRQSPSRPTPSRGPFGRPAAIIALLL